MNADLTAEEQANVRAAAVFLRKRLGTWAKLAEAMRSRRETVASYVRRGTVTAGAALRLARVARAPLEDVLSGRWPTSGMCPYCGQG